MNGFAIKDQFPSFRRAAGHLIPASRLVAGYLNTAFKRTWRVALAVLLLLMVVHGVATFVLGHKVEAELAKIKANSEPVSAAELAGHSLSDDINGAVIYEKAFGLIKQENQRPISSSWDHCDLLSADKRKDPKVWDNAKKAIATYGKALSLAEEASTKPECRFKANWEDGANAQFPYYAPLRQLAKLAAIRAIMQAKDGDMAGAARSLGLVLKMSYATKDDAILVNQCVRWAIIRISAVALKAAADYGQFSDSQARYLASAFSQVDLGPSFIKTMQGERAMILTTFLQVQRHPSNYLGMPFISNSPIRRAYWMLYTSYIGRPVFYRHQLESLRFMQRQIGISGLTYRQIRQLDLRWMDEGGAGLLCAIACPIFIGARSGVDTAMANTRGSQLFLAIRSYRHLFGRYPTSLAELKADVHWSLKTIDPFSGKDFVYKRIGDGFLLYSIGSNLKNDGGFDDYPPEKRATHPHADKPDDIVWKMDH